MLHTHMYSSIEKWKFWTSMHLTVKILQVFRLSRLDIHVRVLKGLAFYY